MIPMSLAEVGVALGTDVRHGIGGQQVRRVTIDSRDVKPGDLFIAIRGERFDGHAFIPEAASKGAVAVVCDQAWHAEEGDARTPGSLVCFPVADCVAALGRLAAYYRRRVMDVATIVIAVTGTNGKTTTKAMIDHVLQASFIGRAAPRNFNNEIGVPLTLLLAEAGDRYLVVEMGTNHRGELATLAEMASPNAALITSIGEAHLEGLGDIHSVASEKASILSSVRADGLAVVNIDRREIHRHLPRSAGPRLITVGLDPAARHSVGDLTGDIHHVRFMLDGRFAVELPLPGPHHATNAAATFAVARWFGMAPERIIERLASFQPPEGRTRVHEFGGVTIVDDAYNANPSSMAAAMEALAGGASGRRVFVMGDMFELGDASEVFHGRAVQAALDAGIECLICVGSSLARAVETCRKAERRGRGSGDWPDGTAGLIRGTHVVTCADATQAVDVLSRYVSSGDTVWVKGSRAMHLEEVVEALRGRLDVSAAVA